MSTGNAGPQRASKNERRDAAREKAREMREAQERRNKRNRLLLQGGIVLAVVAVVAIVAVVIVSSVRPPSAGPRNMASDGVVFGTDLKPITTDALAAGATPEAAPTQAGKVAITVYEDFLCPYCGAFEAANRAGIERLLKAGSATLEIKPVSILDNSSTTAYSTRAANAFACVADSSPDAAWEYHRLLYANQPKEGSAGLTDAQLVSYAKQAGVSPISTVQKCVTDESFKSWVGDATDRFTAKYSGTPTILVNGTKYTGSIVDASAFQSFVLQAGAAYTPTPTASSSASATSTPSASATK